jgi:hypothetical protein
MIRRRLGWFSVFVLAFFPAIASAQQTLAVVERRIRIQTDDEARAILPITNSSSEALVTGIWLKFVDKEGRIVFLAESVPILKPGITEVNIPLPRFMELNEAQLARFGDLRLQYSLNAPLWTRPPLTAGGVIAVSRIVAKPFVRPSHPKTLVKK